MSVFASDSLNNKMYSISDLACLNHSFWLDSNWNWHCQDGVLTDSSPTLDQCSFYWMTLLECRCSSLLYTTQSDSLNTESQGWTSLLNSCWINCCRLNRTTWNTLIHTNVQSSFVCILVCISCWYHLRILASLWCTCKVLVVDRLASYRWIGE